MNTILQLVAAPRRQAILRLVWERERPAGEIARAFDVSFSAVSQHLAKMRDGGVLEVRREGRRRYYRVNRAALGSLGPALESLWTESLDRLKRLAEATEGRSTS